MSTPQYTVLRIKRKATDAPLSSLVISDGDSRAHKRRTVARARGVFRLADTVPHSWQGEGEEGDQLKTRIEGLIAGATKESAAPSAPVAPPVQEVPDVAEATTAEPTVPASTVPRQRQTIPARQASAASSRNPTQFRVVPRAPLRQDPNLPPRVITNAELEAARSALLLVDAQAVASEQPVDKEMDMFQSMLAEYLKVSQGAGPPTGPPPREDDDEYVYDLYYRDLNGDVGDCESMGALLGYEDLSPPSTPPDSEPEDEADEDSNDEDYYRNDYPEDEDADEDMEGFEDAYSDGEWSRDENEHDDERDPWDDYRD